MKNIQLKIRKYLFDFFINGIVMSYFIPSKIRTYILNLLGFNIGKNSIICSNCYIDSKKLIIGKNSYINKNCLIDNNAEVLVGNNVGIAYNVTILTTNHEYNNPNKRTGKINSKKVIIDDGVWIGANCIVLPGTHIQKGVVIGAGSIVKGICESNFLYIGCPAKK